MSGIRLTITGAPEAMDRLAKLSTAGMSRAMRRAMTAGIARVYRRAMANLTGGVLRVDTGRLRQSIVTDVSQDGTSARIGTNVEYAAIHEYGGTTRPHIIRPRNAKALGPMVHGGGMFVSDIANFQWKRAWFTKTGKFKRRFVRSATGRSLLRFASSVNHPGSTVPARPYLRPALESSRDEIRAAVEEALAQALADV